jgi:predicted transcriptional regulator
VKNKKILNLETRRDIYNHVLRFPGIHLSEICKKLKMRKNNVCYHLDFLKKQNLIETTSDDGYIRYYPAKIEEKDTEKIACLFDKSYQYENKKRMLSIFKYYIPGRNDRKVLNLIKRPVPHKIIAFLMIDESSLTEISKCVKKHWTTVKFHLKKLINKDIIESVNYGTEVKYRIKDKEYILKLWFLFYAWKEQIDDNGNLEYKIDYTTIDAAEKFYFEFFPISFRA